MKGGIRDFHGTGVARAVSERVAQAHGIEHVTVQPEAVLEAEAPLPMRPRASSIR